MSLPVVDRPFDPATMCGASRKADDLHGPGHKGDPCRLAKGWGTDHLGLGRCKWHTGSTRSGRRVAAREKVAAELKKMGVAIEVDPQQALLHTVWEAYGNVAFLRAQVQRLKSVVDVDHLGDERQHVLVELYGDWSERLARFAKLALDAGIAQKHLDLMERLAEPIVVVVMAALEGLPADEVERRQGIAVAKLSEFADFDVLASGPIKAAR